MKLADSRTNSLRQRRKALNPYNDTNSFDFELGVYSIGACFIILLLIGFSATSSYLKDACSKLNVTGELKATSLRAPAPVPNPPAPQPNTEGFPPVCTDEQSKKLSHMLPPEGCSEPAFRQKCSFTKATAKGCQDPYWMREFYASTALKSQFNAFFVGYVPSMNQYPDTPVDLLHIGSHDPKYSPKKSKWTEQAGLSPENSCKRSLVEKGDIQEARVVLTVAPGDQGTIQGYQQGSEIPQSVLEVVPDPKIDDAFFTSKLPSADSSIHYLRYAFINPERYGEMKQLTHLSKVWYLEFTLDWKTGLGSMEQQEVLSQFLPDKGFVCYWPGAENLWRITGCWQKHYSIRTWSNVACVNARIPEAKPLLDEMEKIFAETLTKGDVF